MPSLTSDQLRQVLFLLDSDRSPRYISAKLGVHRTTISRLRSLLRPNIVLPTGGRPRKLSPQDERYAIRLIMSGQAETATGIARIISEVKGIHISADTVRRCLKRAGLRAVVKKKKPVLSARHRKARLEFAETYQHYTEADWDRVIFSDEVKINRLGSDGRNWTWKKANEGLSDRLVKGTLKFGGGSIMIWGCMMRRGTGQAARIDGRMDADLYVQILEDDLKGTLEEHDLTVDDVIFQQDNDPKHTSKKAKAWFEANGFVVLKWPAQSPDLNPIEHLWSYIKRRLAAYPEPPKGIEELWERIQDEWAAIPASVCKTLVDSMPARVAAVLKARGGYTKY